jgi:hypothetical protein
MKLYVVSVTSCLHNCYKSRHLMLCVMYLLMMRVLSIAPIKLLISTGEVFIS